jgi:hypothetical protein
LTTTDHYHTAYSLLSAPYTREIFPAIPKVGMGKRKAEDELSVNKNTKRERERQEALSVERKEFERRKKADSMAERRQLDRLRKTADFMGATDDQRAQLIRQCKERVIQQR